MENIDKKVLPSIRALCGPVSRDPPFSFFDTLQQSTSRKSTHTFMHLASLINLAEERPWISALLFGIMNADVIAQLAIPL
jgi:hypothetical protein